MTSASTLSLSHSTLSRFKTEMLTQEENVGLAEDGGYRLEDPERGDTVDGLLRYVHFEPEDLRESYRSKIRDAQLGDEQRSAYLEILETGLGGYTYLED